ncbi:hypothetical protein [Motilibacter deserti]|uniref:LemA protein n=1 Tax=Motilibacter deserti TaxID=2714956 RepID=A0ABX0H1R5_9ACTN|nr:hypothetical protein [Motilibacter deserti]NHC15707.1 hypothetical protein [Motilibacter deserti]
MAPRTTSTRPRPAAPQAQPQRSNAPRATFVVILAALVVALSGWIGYTVGKPDGPEKGSIEAIAAELGAEQKKQAAEQASQLLETVKSAQQAYLPMLRDIAAVLPVGGGQPTFPAASEVAGWQQQAAKLADGFAAEPNGTTGYNVAYEAFSGASKQFDLALRTFSAAVDADPPARDELAAMAAEQRDAAARLWSAGAQQLDLVTIDAGLGHQHFYLPASGSEADIPQEMREVDAGTGGK